MKRVILMHHYRSSNIWGLKAVGEVKKLALKQRSGWWYRVLLGVVTITFGLIIFLWPDITLDVLIFLFGILVLLIGMFSLGMTIFWSRDPTRRLIFLLDGIFGILIGILALFWPDLTEILLAYLIGIWAILFGITEFLAAFYLTKRPAYFFSRSNKYALPLSGALSLIFGVLMIVFPSEGIIAILWLIAAYLVLIGIFNIVYGLQSRPLSTFQFSFRLLWDNGLSPAPGQRSPPSSNSESGPE